MKNIIHRYSSSQCTKLLTDSRQVYYRWLTHKPSNTSLRHQFFLTEIKRVYHEYHGNYSSPRIATQLYQEGIETNKRIVATLMRKNSV